MRTETDRRPLSLLLHKGKDMVTTICCCFFSRRPLGRNIFVIRLFPIPSPLVVHTKERTVQHFLSELEELVASFILIVSMVVVPKQIRGSIECCTRFLSFRRPSCHAVWVSPFATRMASSGAPAQQTS